MHLGGRANAEVLLSLTGSLVLVLVSFFSAMSNPLVTLAVGVAVFALFFLLSRRLDPAASSGWFYMFHLFAFTANLDLVLALRFGASLYCVIHGVGSWLLTFSSPLQSIAGFVPFADFYLNDAEPYFRTGHGLAINLWDATYHWALLLLLLQLQTPFQSSTLGALWAGSTLNSMPVFLIAGTQGAPFSGQWSPAILLNVPYVLAPLVYLIRLQQAHKERNTVAWDRRAYWLVVVAVALHLYRFLHAWEILDHYNYESSYLESSVLFAAIQTAVFTVWAAMVLFSGHNSVDVTIVYAWIGATLQGQFAYIVGSLYHPARYTLPDKSFLPVDFHSFHVFAAVNLVIVALPLAVLALQQRK